MICPEETVELDHEHWGPLVEWIGNYVEERIGREVTAELIVATDYAAVTEAAIRGHGEIFTWGPAGYVVAANEADIEAIVGEISEATGREVSLIYIITRADSGITSLEDLEGKPFAFVDPNSNSGYLWPRYALLKTDVQIGEEFFSGGHAASIMAVINGTVAAAGTSEFRVRAVVQEEVATGAWVISEDFLGAEEYPVFDPQAELGKDDLLLLWEGKSPPTVWTVQKSLPGDVKEALTEAFMAIPGEVIWKPGVAGFIKMVDSDFDIVRDMREVLGD